jgi:putative ABC transport system permease protein
MEDLFVLRLAEARERGGIWSVLAVLMAAVDLLAARTRAIRRLDPRTHRREGRLLMTGSDVRCAFRSLLRQRLATFLVVGMLTLGIAATVTVFGLVNGLFLRPLPFPEADRLVYLNERAPRWDLEYVGINYPDFDQWRKEQRLFEGLALYDGASFNASEGQNVDRLPGAQVTHDFAAVLGIRPVLGRFFTAEEDRPQGPPVVVLGHGLWQERFAGSPDVLGRPLRLDGVARTIVGVMPKEAEFPDRARLFVPLAGDPNQEGQSYSYSGLGRLKPGVTATQAEADLLRTQQPIWEARDKDKDVSPFVRPLREELVRNFKAAAGALLAAVGLLLVVACANVASLMLARALARRREMAIRVAVGASRWRLSIQLLVENVLLAAVGGLLGVLAGFWALRALVAAIPDEVPSWAVFSLDGRVAAFAVLVTGLAAVLFGWAPVIHAMRDDVRSAMAVATGTTVSPRGRRTLRTLVGAEFALAALLLVCGGLLLQAFAQVRKVDPGFEPRGVLTFGVYIPAAGYPDNPKRLAFWESYLEKLRGIPGVESVAAMSFGEASPSWAPGSWPEPCSPSPRHERWPACSSASRPTTGWCGPARSSCSRPQRSSPAIGRPPAPPAWTPWPHCARIRGPSQLAAPRADPA